MRKTNPGLDRIMAKTLRGQVAFIAGQIKNHVSHCAKCSKAGSDPYDHCSAWWTLARKRHQLRRKLRAYERPLEADQLPLPGM